MRTLSGRFTEHKGFFHSVFVALLLIITITTTGCLTSGEGSEDDTDVVAEPDDVPLPPLTPPERTVCDPFNAGASARDRGLVGNLLYITDDLPRYTAVSDYIANGTPVQSTLYFDKLFVPTRAFDLGFYTQDGTLILNHNDQPLYEYFALRLESQLTLATGEAPGWYQLAVLSDDGSKISRKNTDGSFTPIVNNDGTHSTRMGCSSQAVYMDGTNKIPIVVEYFQGPRYHISMVALWRPLPDGADPNAATIDEECGRSGNSRYFDSTVVPSAPSEIYYEMLTRGWKPLDNENFYFPEQASNPCAEAEPLLITNFAITSTTRTSVSLNWITSRGATTRVEIKNVTTGVVTSTTEDTTLTTSHPVTVSSLTANTLYSVKGISVSSDGQTAISSESAFRTPR